MADALDFWIYRDGRESRSGIELRAELERLVAAVLRSTGELRRRRALDAVIASGTLEAALADAGDAGDPAATSAAASVAALTDVLATAALGVDGNNAPLRAASARFDTSPMPARLVVSEPEGFAYYALHPEAYARALRRRPRATGEVLVVGIRSIGTTLSAFARAELRRHGEAVERITVRPTGHPYDRHLDLDDAQRDAVSLLASRRGEAIVVDEGPGRSGSTLLATAEALERAGLPADRIMLLCSNAPSPALAARNAAVRFARFPVTVVPSDVRVPASQVDLSAGAWRCLAYEPRGGAYWPASFTQTERRKLLTLDGRLAKFEGLGRGARRAAERGEALAAAGISPAARDEADGWLSYAWEGAPLSRTDLDSAMIARLAEYCAMRPRICPGAQSTAGLEPMVAKNLSLLAPGAAVPALAIERPAIVDGRMAPHEWLRRHDGHVVKTDAISHGDDHFFPGPTDIAWDLAGAIVEWELDDHAATRLVSLYRRASRDDVTPRLPAWILAYSTFRAAFTSVGRSMATSPAEEARLARDLARYRAVVGRVLTALATSGASAASGADAPL